MPTTIRVISTSFWLAFALTAFSRPSFAVIEKGEFVENRCWTTVEEKPYCLDYAPDTVRVLIHNTGWCPPCNMEMASLVPRLKEFEGKPVTFISLSAQGWTHGSLPTKEFLKEWKEKHQIPFTVAASPKDAGKSFFEPPLYIPNVVIIDRNGVLVYKEAAPEVDDIFREINAALSQR